jgi:hypothetical protein
MRGGILERMTTLNNEVSPSRTLTGGIFVAPYSVSASGIILRDLSGSVIAEISDTRGTLHLLSSDYSLQALSTTKTRPLSIQVLTRS